MEFMLILIASALSFYLFGKVLDFIFVKAGYIENKDSYTLTDIKEIKQKGILYLGSAYIRFSKIPEISKLSYKEKQAKFSEL